MSILYNQPLIDELDYCIYTIDEFDECREAICTSGYGVYAKDSFLSNVNAEEEKPLDATHVVWYVNDNF